MIRRPEFPILWRVFDYSKMWSMDFMAFSADTAYWEAVGHFSVNPTHAVCVYDSTRMHGQGKRVEFKRGAK